MPRAESIEAAMLVAKAAEKRRLFITLSFPSGRAVFAQTFCEPW